ncbi:MAG: M50 family metallopeptidase [Oscillospiraceae bacterium]|jgi:membrane-associated protease RseP (regulator of RpoE activity)|nr:M50 family metallopeptidase [Oscillospiraceae bacterium]
MRLGRFTVTGGFVLLWGFMVFLGEGRLLALCLATALTHELGHLAAVWLCGGQVETIELNAAGAVIRLGRKKPLSYPREIACVLAGPFASLACALIFCFINVTIASAAAGMCLVQGAFNLLPAQGLDGGRALLLYLESREHPRASVIVRVTTVCAALALTAFCAAAFVYGGGFMTLCVAAFALTAMLGGIETRYL